MAWIRTGTAGVARVQPQRKPSTVAFCAGVAGALALAVAVWLWVRGGEGPAAGSCMGGVRRPAPRTAPARPASAPASAPNASPATAEAAPAPRPPQPRTYRDERGILRYEGGARVPGQRPLASQPLEPGTRRPKVFRHAAEKNISQLLEMKVGEPVVGDYAYGDAFRRSFRESLAEPVEILDTDDARTRELKAAVQETKEDLKRRMAAGEDVAKVMNDTLDEFRRLARFRSELQSQLRELRSDGETYSERDVEDFTRAANEMLKEEGLPPLTLPRAVMRGLRQ